MLTLRQMQSLQVIQLEVDCGAHDKSHVRQKEV